MLKKWIMGLSSVAVISLGSAGVAQASHGGETINCSDFSSGEEVWEFWDEHGYDKNNDPEGLDRDSDGLPCESLTEEIKDRFVDTEDNSEPVVEEDSSTDSDSSTTEETTDTEEPAEETAASTSSSEEDSTEEGGALPETATANPMMALFGVLAAGAGAALLIRRKTIQ